MAKEIHLKFLGGKMENQLLTDKEAAKRLGIGRTKIHELVKEGKLPCVNFMRGRRFNSADLDKFILEHTECLKAGGPT
jgi:excisionase family DNA binding protein